MGEEIITPIVVGEVGEPLPVVCSYPSPMPGCNYVPGPAYDAATSCGMIMSCTGLEEDLPIDPLPVMCDHAAPPMGCDYVPGP